MRKLILLFATCFACASVAAAQSKPVDVSAGWNYSRADQGNGYANLNGWYGSLTWEATQRVGLNVTHESFWGTYRGSSQNQHAWLGGFNFKLLGGNPNVSPFVQTLGGATRSSSFGSVQWQPTLQLAAGADITLKGNLSLELIPAEYNLSFATNNTLHSYQAAAGLQYSFGK